MRAFNTTLSASAVSQAKNPHGCAAARQALEAVREADVQVKQAEEQLVIMEHVALSAREQIKRHAQDEAEAHAQAERELQRVRAEMKLKAKRQQVCVRHASNASGTNFRCGLRGLGLALGICGRRLARASCFHVCIHKLG